MRRDRIFPLAFLLSVALSLPILQIGEAAETVVVDLATNQGPAGDPIATGFRGSWSNATPENLLFPLKPSQVDGPAAWPASDSLWSFAARTGATIEIKLYDTLPEVPGVVAQDPSDVRYMWATTPGTKAELMAKWTDRVIKWVRVAEHLRYVGNDTIPIVYEVHNEPDLLGEWHPTLNDSFYTWGVDSVGLFNEVWEAAYRTIKDSLSSAVIAGPSFSYNVLGAPSNYPYKSGVQMIEFLNYCDEHDCMPTILGWHDLGRAEYADTDFADEPHCLNGDCDSTWNLLAQVDFAKRLVNGQTSDSLSLTHRPTMFEINETVNGDEIISPAYRDRTPGVMVREFALAERAKPLGLVKANRGLWCDPCIEENKEPGDVNFAAFTIYTHLNGLVWPCCEDDASGESYYYTCNHNWLWTRRYAWWAEKTYAALEGTFLEVTADSVLDGLAAIDGDSLTVLVGKFSLTNQDDVNIVLRNVGTLAVNGAVNALIERMLGGPGNQFFGSDQDTLRPVFVRDGRELVYGDSCVIAVPAVDFGPGDALNIKVTKITSSTVEVPG